MWGSTGAPASGAPSSRPNLSTPSPSSSSSTTGTRGAKASPDRQRRVPSNSNASSPRRTSIDGQAVARTGARVAVCNAMVDHGMRCRAGEMSEAVPLFPTSAARSEPDVRSSSRRPAQLCQPPAGGTKRSGIAKGLQSCLLKFLLLDLRMLAIGQLNAVILEDLDCPCTDADGVCFIPVCPKGMYQCCFDCTLSTCDKDELGFFPHGELYLSERGVLECLQCKSGDFCSGCDSYQACPSVMAKDSKGGVYDTPRVSPAGSILDRECQRCPDGFEADFNKDRCVPPFREQCDMTLMEICISGCKENPTNDECQRMECRIFCANDQRDSNPECLDAHKEMCLEFNLPEVDPNQQLLPGLATTTESPTILLTDDSGIATVAPFRQEVACNVNCNTAAGRSISAVVALLAMGSYLLML